MTKHDLGLPSGIQDSTYQQNREKEIERLKIENGKIRQENRGILQMLLKGS
jgi:hypothetical protein